MDLLLTPLVTRVLKQYVKRSAEGAGRDLKVSFSRGGALTLHNLELDLAPLLGGAASLAHVRRAFARRLSITIPWTAITTQPIQVVLDTVELVLSAAEQTPAPTPVPSSSALSEDSAGSRAALSSAAEDDGAAAGGPSGGGWFGSTLQSMALRAGVNVTVKLTNVVAKWVEEGQFVAAATFQELLVQTSADDWGKSLQNPEAWLKKECSIRQLTISLDQHSPAATAAPAHIYQPLLRIASLSASALLPAFAWLEGADLAGDAFNTSVRVQLSPLNVAVNDRQLRWAGALLAIMQAAAAAKRAAEEAAEEAAAADGLDAFAAAAGPGSPTTPTPAAGPTVIALASLSSPSNFPSPGPPGLHAAPRPQAKALGVFGRVWDFLIDEASYVEAAEGVSPKPGDQPGLALSPPPQQQLGPAALPMYAELQVTLERLHVVCGVVVERQHEQGATAPAGAVPAAAAQQVASPGRQQQQWEAPDLEDTLRRLREATASNSLEAASALQRQLAAALEAADASKVAGAAAASQRGQAHAAHFEVHPCAELHLEQLKVAVASVDASISGAAADLKRLTLKRSAAAAPLLDCVLAPEAAGEQQPGRHASHLTAATAAGGGGINWVEVLALEPEQPLSPGSAQHQAAQPLAVSMHYFDSAAVPGSSPARGGEAAPGHYRCSITLGHVLLAHAPGFATSMVLLAQQFQTGAAAARAASAALTDAAAGGAAWQQASSPVAARQGQEAAALAGGGSDASSSDSAGSSPALLSQALQPQLLLECRIVQMEAMALSSQAADACAVLLMLRGLELRSGALNWGAPWNTRLRSMLLAPAAGFEGHGLRLGLAAAEVAVADANSAAAGECAGLWQLDQAAALSNVVLLEAVMMAAPQPEAAAEAEAAGSLLLSAALSPLQLQATGQQVAALAAIGRGVAAEVSAGFSGLLSLSAADEQEVVPWLGSASLSCSECVQLAYAAAGGLQQWGGPHGGSDLRARPSVGNGSATSSGDAAEPDLFLSLGTVTAALTATHAPAAAQEAVPAAAPAQQQQVVAQVQLVQAHAWLQPQLSVQLPAAEVRFGHVPGADGPVLQPEPAVLIAGLGYSQHAQQLQAAEAWQQQQQLSSVAVQSVSIAVGPADYALAAALLHSIQRQPALPAVPVLQPTFKRPGPQQEQQQQQQLDQQPGEPAGAAGEAAGFALSIEAASASIWPHAEWSAQQAEQRRHQSLGLAVWLSALQLRSEIRSQPAGSSPGSSSSSMRVSLGCAHAALLQRRPGEQQQLGSSGGSLIDLSPVLCFPDAALGQQAQQQQQHVQRQPALELSLTAAAGGGMAGSSSLSPSRGPAASGRRMQLHAAPVSLAVSQDLMALLGRLSADLRGPQLPDGEQGAAPPSAAQPGTAPQAPRSEPEGLQGKAALQGVRLLLLEAAAWGGGQAGDGPTRDVQAATSCQPAPGSAAVEVVIEEAVLLLQQAPAAENRPWLSGSHAAVGAVLTSLDASLMGAAITVWHAGQPGAGATRLLPPTDGRLQLLLHPLVGTVGVGLHAQFLPLQICMPAVSALAAVISAVFGGGDGEGGEQQQGRQQQPDGHASSQAAGGRHQLGAVAAATVVIEDASATLEHPHHALPAAAAGAQQTAASGDGQPWSRDDLSAALFTFVHSGGSSSDSRPEPLQVHAFGGASAGSAVQEPGRGLASRIGAQLWGGRQAQGSQQAGEDGARQGIRWCYPQLREVAMVAVEDAPAALLAATFQLSFFSEEEGDYVAVPLQAVMLDSISSSGKAAGPRGSGKVLLLLAESGGGEAGAGSLAAAEWEVSWELPPGPLAASATTSAVLQRLRVNPRPGGEAAAVLAGLGRPLWVPPPLAASFTFVLTAESGSLSLLAPAPLLLLQGMGQQHASNSHHSQQQRRQQGPALALLDTAAVLQAGSLKAAVHTYPSPEGSTLLAADLQATLALCLPDSSSATAPAATAAAAPGWAVVEPFQLEAMVEYASQGCTDSLQQQHQAAEQQREGTQEEEEGGSEEEEEEQQQHGQQRQRRRLFWRGQTSQQQQELALLAVRRPPVHPGLALGLAAASQPLVVNASEGLLAELKRVVAALSSAPAPDDSSAAASPAAQAAASAPLLLVNRSSQSVRLRQQGTQHQQLQLLPGQSLPLVWPAPPALVSGATRRVQLALAGAGEDEAAWSAPVDVMAASGRQLLLPSPGGGSSLAVRAQHSASGAGWEVQLVPAARVVNHLSSPVHICLSQDVVVSTNVGGKPKVVRQLQHQPVEVASGGSVDAEVPNGSSLLRLWLGGDVSSGGGWSQAVSLPQFDEQQLSKAAPVLMVLHCSPAAAASAVGAGVKPPAAAATAAQQLGAVLAQIVPPDGASGQASIHLWPSLLLRNEMPCPVRVLLPAVAQAGPAAPGAKPAPQQAREAVLQPGAGQQLMVPLYGGAVGGLLSLEAPVRSPAASNGHSPDSSSPGSGGPEGRPGLQIVVPPLIAESAEQQWFGGASARPAAGAGGPAAVFIAPPGEAAFFRLPLRIEAPGGLPASPPWSAEGSSGAKDSGAISADCLLVTQQHTDGLPLLQLVLQPALAVHNCLPVPLLFQVPGAAPVEIPAGWSLPLPAGHSPGGGAADEAVVMLPLAAPADGGAAAAAGNSQGQQQAEGSERPLLLRSQPFRLEPEGEAEGASSSGSAHLVLTPEQPAGLARAGGGGLWRSSSTSASTAGAQHAQRLECRLAARVEVQQHAAVGGTATAAAVSVMVTAGCFVSNLTGLPLAMLAEGAAEAPLLAAAAPGAAAGQPPDQQAPTPEPGVLSPQDSTVSMLSVSSAGTLTPWLGGAEGAASSSTGAAQHGVLLLPAATAPLLQLWRGGARGGRSRSQRQGSWGSTSEMLRSFSGGLLPSSSQQGAAGSPHSRPALRFSLVETPAEGQAAGGADASTSSEPAAGRPASLQPAMPRWSGPLQPYAAAGRQRLYLQPPSAEGEGGSSSDGDSNGLMLTYRVLLTHGAFHLVLFRDRQPPFVIQNATGAAMDVGYFPPVEAPDGGFAYGGPQAALRVAAGHSLECDFKPARPDRAGEGGPGGPAAPAAGVLSPRKSAGGAGSGWEDQEDEDAFLDCLLREELQAAGRAQQRPPAVLKFRPAGAKEWQHPCVLLPGLHLASGSSQGSPGATGRQTSSSGGGGRDGQLAQVHISKCCATTRILLLPQEGAVEQGASSVATGSVAAGGAQLEGEQEHPLPLRLDLRFRQLQVCLWDDERQRLLPLPGAGGATPLGRELFALSLDHLHCQLFREQRLAAPWGAPGSPPAGAGQHRASSGGSSSSRAGGGGSGAGGSGAGSGGSHRLAHPWQRQALLVMSAHLTAEALQLDSFLPGSEQPVLLTTLPPEDVEAGHAGSRRQRHGPPLQLLLEVNHCPSEPAAADSSSGGTGVGSSSFGSSEASGGGQQQQQPGMSLRNSWVKDLLIQLPTLAAAADDSLLLFAEGLAARLSAGSAEDASITAAGIPPAAASQSAAAAEGSAPAGGPSGVAAAPASDPQPHMQQGELLQQALRVEAAGAAASRLYIEQAVVESVRLLLDAHIAAGTAGVPVAVDTYRAPVTLSRIAAHDVLFRPHILVRGLMAHGVAEALLNAPQVLGSLSLLFNPTGLVRSVRAGVSDLIGLPLAALQNQSLTQFISGVGQGSVSLVRHTLGWTLTSISGFSQAFSRAVDSAVTLRQGASGAPAGSAGGALAHRPPPAHLGHGLAQGLVGLAEGVAAGITGVVSAPLQGYSSGSGVLGGIGRGLLGVVGLPVSGALELVGSVSAGLASSAGVVHVPQPRRPGRLLETAAGSAPGEAAAGAAAGAAVPPVVASPLRLMQHPALLAHLLAAPGGFDGGTAGAGAGPTTTGGPADGSSTGTAGAASATAALGRYLCHAPLASATVLQGAEGLRSAHFSRGFALQRPLLLVSEAVAVVFSEGGLEAVLVLPLADTEFEARYSSQELSLFSRAAAPAGRPSAAAPAAVLCALSREGWLLLVPLLRRRCSPGR